MQTDPQNDAKINVFSALNCQQHPEEPIRFLCISTQICSKANLLCTECIDSSGKDHNHQLISLGRFHNFIKNYSSRSTSYTTKAQQAIKNLSEEVNQQINNLQNLSMKQFNLGINDELSTDDALRTKMQELACKSLWARLHEKIQKQEDMEQQIGIEIDLYWQPTTDSIKDILHMAKESCEKLQSEYTTLKDDNSESSKSGLLRLRKRETVLKSIPIVDEIDSDEESDEDMEQDDIEEYHNNDRKKPQVKKKKTITKIKRYTEEQKLNIIKEIKRINVELNSTNCKKMIAKRYKIAASTLIRWEKWYDREYGKKFKSKGRRKGIEEIKIQDSA